MLPNRRKIVTYLFIYLAFSCAISIYVKCKKYRGYMLPGENTAYINNLVLIYLFDKSIFGPSSELYDRITAKELLPYVAYVSNNGTIIDTFFDGILLLAFLSPYGRAYIETPPYYGENLKPSNLDDWRIFINESIYTIKEIDKAVKLRNSVLGITEKEKVVIMIPYPDPTQHKFGEINGEMLDFYRETDRLNAIKWFIDEFLLQLNSVNVSYVEFVGFYWMRESMVGSDVNLVKSVNAYIHKLNLRSFWIPYYFSDALEVWDKLGFDAVVLQPNYFFYFWAEQDRIKNAAEKARKYGLGVEIEIDHNIFDHPEIYRERYIAYLKGGIKYGYNKAFKAYYQELDVYLRAAYSTNPNERWIYDATYNFSKGLEIKY